MSGSIIGYYHISAAVGWGDVAPCKAPLVNHTHGMVYSQFGGAESDLAGVRRHDAWPNGSEAAALDYNSIPIHGGFLVSAPWALTYNRQLVAVCGGQGSNSSGFSFLDQRTLDFVSSFGIISSDLSPSGGDRMLAPACCVAIQNGGSDFIIATTDISSGEVICVDIGAGGCAVVGTMTEGRGVLGALPDGSGTSAFVLGREPSDEHLPLTLYRATTTALVTIGVINPSAFGPGWTSTDIIYGLAIDQVDGNPIVAIGNALDGKAPILAKLSAVDASVVWTTDLLPVGHPNFSQGDLQQALITQQKFYYIGTDNHIVCVDTSTGASTVVTPYSFGGSISGSAPQQVSEDVVGSVYFNGSFSPPTPDTTYHGTWMAGGGHKVVANNTPMRYFPATEDPMPPPPVPLNSSRQRSWTFTLDGHKFYVLDLGTQGTMLYDTTTKSWCEFGTTGYPNWNFRNGTMWNQRMVGGDTDTPQIYEMSPSSMKDGGTLPITHVVSGGLTTRTRTFMSVAGVRLNTSVGTLDDDTGATVLLEFSDDQGKTWISADPIVLTENDYNEELAWRSLGSFAAPGRVFRITDVGGFIRIDGCDAEIDNFDEDGNGATQDT